ncbi:hypothetical protein Zmor_014071 [Zophobas morio]|uniref:Peptidase metallopeptidase domain-containing protein n=1 Tax=Zophobas morio TaxID=2755281 RepID=A0AA38IH46_9CUCU|nr:hypothetical protein Zmor_014071 [Zophobas morio]
MCENYLIYLISILLFSFHSQQRSINEEDFSRIKREINLDQVFISNDTETPWKRRQITYKIQNYSTSLTKEQLHGVFEDVVKIWTKNINLTITEARTNNADINIYFTDLDGVDNSLGYAYMPEDGDIFFDIDEEWTLDQLQTSDTETYFPWVAAHEFGHSLGLTHSKSKKSIMSEYYVNKLPKLSKTDIKKLESLYGPLLNKTVLCTGTSIDEILMINFQKYFLFKGNQYWEMTNTSLKSGPYNVKSIFLEFPDNIDAAFVVKENIYVLKHNVSYIIDYQKNKYRRKLISVAFDYLPSNIDAAFYVPKEKIIYFFKGAKYYVLDTERDPGDRLIVNGKSILADWDGVPNNVDAATLLNTSKVLFIKSGRCYVVNLKTKQLSSSSECASSFYRC